MIQPDFNTTILTEIPDYQPTRHHTENIRITFNGTDIFRTFVQIDLQMATRKTTVRKKNGIAKSSDSTAVKMSRFDTKLPQDQKERFEYAASLGGYRTLTDFLISSAQQRANEIIQQHEGFLIQENDRKIFFDALLNPPKPGKNLLNAAKSFQKLLSTK